MKKEGEKIGGMSCFNISLAEDEFMEINERKKVNGERRGWKDKKFPCQPPGFKYRPKCDTMGMLSSTVALGQAKPFELI